MITTEQYNVLQDFTTAFVYALKANCVPAFTKEELDKMEDVYKSLGYSLDNRRCGHCVLSMVQILGKEYNNYEQELNTKGNRQEKVSKRSKSNSKVGNKETTDSK